MEIRETATQPSDPSLLVDRATLIASFTERAASLGVAVIRVADSDAAATEISTIAAKLDVRIPLASTELAQTAPALCAALVGRGMTPSPPAGPDETNDAPLGLSLAHLAVAETGSVLFAEESLADRSIGLLAKEQVVVCPTPALVPSLDDAVPVLRSFATRPGGSYTTLVTGPSRTADIERALTVGVQGPAKLSVLFVDELT
jgi:L-lactate dehydrogenase complex protein LldG